jgi:hypothetical protein
LRSGRIDGLGATTDFHHGLLAQAESCPGIDGLGGVEFVAQPGDGFGTIGAGCRLEGEAQCARADGDVSRHVRGGGDAYRAFVLASAVVGPEEADEGRLGLTGLAINMERCRAAPFFLAPVVTILMVRWTAAGRA